MRSEQQGRLYEILDDHRRDKTPARFSIDPGVPIDGVEWSGDITADADVLAVGLDQAGRLNCTLRFEAKDDLLRLLLVVMEPTSRAAFMYEIRTERAIANGLSRFMVTTIPIALEPVHASEPVDGHIDVSLVEPL